jgi:hypothetical protein
MVHALEQARQQLVPDGVLISIQPRRAKDAFIAITAPGQRQPVAALVNPVFEPIMSAADAAIQTVVDQRRFALMGRSNHHFRVRLASPLELRRYLDLYVRPPRFPAGGRQRLQAMWRNRPEGARIEVTEFFAIIALRAIGFEG